MNSDPPHYPSKSYCLNTILLFCEDKTVLNFKVKFYLLKNIDLWIDDFNDNLFVLIYFYSFYLYLKKNYILDVMLLDYIYSMFCDFYGKKNVQNIDIIYNEFII